MKYLYPEDPTKRFRKAEVKSEQAEPAADGEEFFVKNFGKRRR